MALASLSGCADAEQAASEASDAGVATVNSGVIPDADTGVNAGGADPVAADADATGIRLHFYYREDVSGAQFTSKNLLVTVSHQDMILEIDDSETQRLDFQDIYVLVTSFASGFVVHFFDKRDDELLQRILYQTAGSLENTFGSHGLTGLHYVYHKSGAELQYWAVVEE